MRSVGSRWAALLFQCGMGKAPFVEVFDMVALFLSAAIKKINVINALKILAQQLLCRVQHGSSPVQPEGVNTMMKKLLASACGAAALLIATPAAAVPVGLELVLLIDVSGSVDTAEYNMQKSGYVSAFQSAAVQNAIIGSTLGKIAVTFVEWSGSAQQSQMVGWTLIDSAASSNAFASAINAATRAFTGQTGIQSAIRYGAGLFGTETGGTSNGYESVRQVMDVSGDGECNDGNCTVAYGRDYALGQGVDTINGLAIGPMAITNYYNNSVKGGGGFVIDVANFTDFAAAIERKLVKEISNDVPEPFTLALLGIGLLGVGAARRRATKA